MDVISTAKYWSQIFLVKFFFKNRLISVFFFIFET